MAKKVKRKVHVVKVRNIHPVVKQFIAAPPPEVAPEVVALVQVVAQPDVEIHVPEPIEPEKQTLWESFKELFS